MLSTLSAFVIKRKVQVLLLVSSIVYGFVFDFMRWVHHDYPSYIGGARLMFGLQGGFDYQSRLTKPLSLVIPGGLEWLTGLHPVWGFMLQNIVFYFLAGWFLYLFLARLTGDLQKAWLGLIVWVGSQSVAIFSFAVLTDIGGWFFGIWGLYLIVKADKPKDYFLPGIVAGIGILFKENALIAPLFLFFGVLFSDKALRYKLISLVVYGIPFIILFAGGQVLSFAFTGDSLLHRFSETHDHIGFVWYNRGNIMQIWRVFDVFGLLFIPGVYLWWRNRIWTDRRAGWALLIAALTGFVAMPLLYPFVVDRLLFGIAPLLIPFVAAGAYSFKKYASSMIWAGAIVNICGAWAIYAFNIQGVLPVMIVSYSCIGVFFWLRRNNPSPIQRPT